MDASLDQDAQEPFSCIALDSIAPGSHALTRSVATTLRLRSGGHVKNDIGQSPKPDRAGWQALLLGDDDRKK